MTKIIQLKGTENRLYELIAPLVMNPDILHYNNNYPFKTSEQFTWFIAISNEKVVGFMPLELRNSQWIINNYYITPSREEDEIFTVLLKDIIQFTTEKGVTAVVQTKHKDYFSKQGFNILKEWKLYLKMRKDEQQ